MEVKDLQTANIKLVTTQEFQRFKNLMSYENEEPKSTHFIIVPEWVILDIANNQLKHWQEYRNELLQRFNDYETPLTMTAEEVREIITDYQPNKPTE